ncbi:MAG: fibronectin type III domain-containing protein [Ignavibacteriae bacterium]|nr:fibronectin type III domain-containing protein [Ignavibacteriota bacterium]
MAKSKIKLGLATMQPQEKVEFSSNVLAKMTGNANFPNPNPDLNTVQQKQDDLKLVLSNLEQARQTVAQLAAEAEEKEKALDESLSLLASYVENVSNGDEVIILSSGMSVRSTVKLTKPMPQVLDVRVSQGTNEGEVDLRWKSIKGAKSYALEYSPDPIGPSTWTHGGIAPKAKFTIGNLESGKKYWFRVAAVGAEGRGMWSDPAVKWVG